MFYFIYVYIFLYICARLFCGLSFQIYHCPLYLTVWWETDRSEPNFLDVISDVMLLLNVKFT